MNELPEPHPDVDDVTWYAYVQQRAQAAIILELRQYDWSALDRNLLIKIHGMLPGLPL